MPATEELDKLTLHIRKALPDPKAVTHLQTNPQAGLVEFSWHSRHYVVTPALVVFELKDGKNLLVTGYSMLIQAALQTRDRNSKIIEEVVKKLGSADENMRTHQERGLALLGEVKKTLLRLAGKRA